MPEGPEVTTLSQYLLTKLLNKIMVGFEILSGKYSKKPMDNYDILNSQYVIKNIDSKGKLMWFELANVKNGKIIYITSHLGLTGFWSFEKGENDRIKMSIVNQDNTKKYYLYYEDDRNFGNIEIYTIYSKFSTKLNDIALDSLKTNYTDLQFVELYENYLNKTNKRASKNISLVLMDQKAILSGIGNYLMAEILYNAKISPHRTLGSLTKGEIKKLGKSIKYLVKLSYYNNITGYMAHFGDFISVHKDKIDNKFYPNYHADTKLKKNDKFEFKIYRQKKDPFGNHVEPDKSIQKTRTTYWVPNVQK